MEVVSFLDYQMDDVYEDDEFAMESVMEFGKLNSKQKKRRKKDFDSYEYGINADYVGEF